MMSIQPSNSSPFTARSSALLQEMRPEWLQRIVTFLAPNETRNLESVNRAFRQGVEIERRKLWTTINTHSFIEKITRDSSYLRQNGLSIKQKLNYVARMIGSPYLPFDPDNIEIFQRDAAQMSRASLFYDTQKAKDRGLIDSLLQEEAIFAEAIAKSEQSDIDRESNERGRKVPKHSDEETVADSVYSSVHTDPSLAALKSHIIISRILQNSTFINQPGITIEKQKAHITVLLLSQLLMEPLITPKTAADFKKLADKVSEEKLFRAAVFKKDIGLIRSFSFSLAMLEAEHVESYFKIAVCNHLNEDIEKLIPYLSTSFLSEFIHLADERDPRKNSSASVYSSYIFYVDCKILKMLLQRRNFDASHILEEATDSSNQELIQLALQNKYGKEASLDASAQRREGWQRGLQKAIMTAVNNNDLISFQKILSYSIPSQEMLKYARDWAVYTQSLRNRVPEQFRNATIHPDFKFKEDRAQLIEFLNQKLAQFRT